MPSTARAAQEAVVTSASADVHQLPRTSSAQLSSLPKDVHVRVSSETIRDTQGEVWHKVRLPAGDFGFVRTKDLRLIDLERIMRVSGHDRGAVREGRAEIDGPTWAYSARVMGAFAYEVTTETRGFGFEAEALTDFWFLDRRGEERHRYGMGLAFAYLPKDLALMAAFVYRMLVNGLLEPELRLRAGWGFTSASTLAAGAFGVRSAIAGDPTFQWNLYAEAGYEGTFVSTAPSHLYFSAGLGVNF
jgi:hypothetical protein